MGESRLERAGLGGIWKLGNDVGPVSGADMGALVNGLGGTREADAEAEASALSTAEALSEAESVVAVAGDEGLVLAAEAEVVGDADTDWSSLALLLPVVLGALMLLSSGFSLASVAGKGSSGVVSAAAATMGELRDMALERKSVYASGGLMGVLTKSGSALHKKAGRLRLERGVAVLTEVAEVISEGKLLVTGVATSSLGLGPGILKRNRRYGRLVCGRKRLVETLINQDRRTTLAGIEQGCRTRRSRWRDEWCEYVMGGDGRRWATRVLKRVKANGDGDGAIK